MTEMLMTPVFWGSLATLTFLEIVLGIDNILFISIATGKLEGKQRKQAQRIGIWGAMALRILMLGLIFWIIQLDRHALFHVPPDAALMIAGGDRLAAEHIGEVTIKDLILLAGGLFLLWKGSQEIHAAGEGTHHGAADASAAAGDEGDLAREIGHATVPSRVGAPQAMKAPFRQPGLP